MRAGAHAHGARKRRRTLPALPACGARATRSAFCAARAARACKRWSGSVTAAACRALPARHALSLRLPRRERACPPRSAAAIRVQVRCGDACAWSAAFVRRVRLCCADAPLPPDAPGCARALEMSSHE
jgi:hypothetical protein